jgi:preprotein translocase subunit YajC
MQAAAEAAQATSGFQGFWAKYNMWIMIALMLVVVYFFIIRPQQKQQKELAKFRNSLEKGQRVITAGGIHGSIKEVKETTVVINIDKDVAIEVDKGMITRAPGDTTAAK